MSATATYTQNDFFYNNSTICSSMTGDCAKNRDLGNSLDSKTNTLASEKRKVADMRALYAREILFTFNMIVGCIGLGLYIKFNQ